MVTLVAVVTLRGGSPKSAARSRRKTVHTIEPLGSRPTFRSGAAVSGAITEAMPMTTDGIEKFKAIVMLANRVAWSFNEGVLNTCILTSYALAAALTDLGYADARPVRVEAASYPDDLSSLVSSLADLRAAAPKRVIGAGISRSASGRAGCLIRLSIKLTAAPNGLMLALVSSRWQRPSHLNFGQTLMRCGCLSLPDPRAIG